ncbi:hypothetical protein [Chitinophaga sp.]|uniref:hypothetical protein n=1 Tax=Chitinophaga sp. TaxID=1869181 RepID=UPI0031E3E20C
MAYEVVKYQISFQDEHYATPANWRIDIRPFGGVLPAEPIVLTPAGAPLVLEYTNSDESKRSWIVGRKATIKYVYTGGENIPLPTEFFDTDERYHRVEIFKNDVLDGVYFIKPDSGQYDFRFPPFEVTLTAVDGLAFGKTVNFNMYQDGQLKYDRVTLYEAIVQRGLYQTIDSTVPVNVINSLYPSNIEAAQKLLLGSYVHTDMFYDFVKGPISTYDMLEYFCINFYSRVFIANNQVWIVRSSDLYQDEVGIDQYVDSAVNAITVPSFINVLGPGVGLFDGVPVDFNGNIRLVPAVKKATFKVEYKSINRLVNFTWLGWTGTDFPGWTRFGNPPIDRVGTATIDDPYRLVVYRDPVNPSTIEYLYQSVDSIMGKHDLLEFSFKYKFNGTTNLTVSIMADDPTITGFFRLDSSGSWVYDFGSDPTYIQIQRSGKKRDGSFSIKANPLSATKESSHFPNAMRIRISIYLPTGQYNPAGPDYNPLLGPPEDGVANPNVEFWPMKIGVISTGATGRDLTITNNANYSLEQDETSFQFIDTGEVGLSNTLFVSAGVPAATWNSAKAGVTARDIEEHMARANVDQYAKSITTFESSVYSNTIQMYNVFKVDTIPGKRYMMLSDSYKVKKCIHNVLLEEVLPEGGASVTYVETDIENDN